MSGIPPPLNSIRILHIDDSPDDREILKQTLEEIDPEMEVFSASAPSESIRLMGELRVDCVISDYSMPEMDGIELCRKIRDTSGVPFIVYTGKGSEEVASVAFEAGADDYLRKEPGHGHYRVLANRVRQAVERRWGDGLYRNVLENTRDSIIIAQGTRIVYANQATAKLAGVSSVGELLETDALDWILKKDRRRIQSILLGRQRGEPQPSRFEIEFQRSDGERRVLEVSSSLIHYKGRPASLSVVRDVSDKVRVRERLAALHNCTLKLASAESIEEIAKQTLDSIEEVFDFRWGDISVIEDGRLIQVYFKGVIFDDFEILSLDGPGVVARAARTGESQLVYDTRVDDDYLPTLIDDDIITLSELAVPIKENGSVIGVLNLESPVLNGFSADDQRLLEIFSQYVASAVVRIRNEDLLKASEEKYRNILESSLDGVTVTKDTKIVFANQSFAEMIGCEDPSELLGRSSWDVVAPEFHAHIQERGNKRREGDRSTFRYDMNFVGKDGTPFYVESQTSAIEFEGEPAVLGVHRDINERKRLDAELRDSEARWRSLVALAPDGIITFNPLGFVTSINDIFVELTGFSKDEIVGKHFTKLGTLRARDMPKYMRLFSSIIKGQTPHPLDFKYRRKDGSMGWGQAHMRSIKVGDKSREILMILRETSERKRLEEEVREHTRNLERLVEERTQELVDAERLVAAGKVSAMVGHDLRGPLVVVKNAVDLARKNPERTDRMLDMIERNAGHAMEILEELRTLTRDEPITLAPVEMGKLLGKVTEDTFLPTGVELRLEIDEDLPEIVLDEAKTMRALKNIIQNAKDAMPGGGVLTIGAKRKGDQVFFSVSDTGVGITDEARGNLFKPFYTTKPKGMGLGLASTRRMVEVQGGTIFVESKDDEGSTFSIALPLKDQSS